MTIDYDAFAALLKSTMETRGLNHLDVADSANVLGENEDFGEEILGKHIKYMLRGCPQKGHDYPARIVLVAKALGIKVPGEGNGSVALVPTPQQAEAAVPRLNGVVHAPKGKAELTAIEVAYNAFAELPEPAQIRAHGYLGLLLHADKTETLAVAEDRTEG